MLASKKEKQREYSKKWRDKNPQYMKDYRKAHKEELAFYNSTWAKDNAGKRAATSSRYHASKLQAIPKWTTEDDLWLIEECYTLAKLRSDLTGIKWHVDHIIPLQGIDVCGLHTILNLRVIPATENLSKKNKFMMLHE